MSRRGKRRRVTRSARGRAGRLRLAALLQGRRVALRHQRSRQRVPAAGDDAGSPAGKERVLIPGLDRDVDDFAISFDAQPYRVPHQRARLRTCCASSTSQPRGSCRVPPLFDGRDRRARVAAQVDRGRLPHHLCALRGRRVLLRREDRQAHPLDQRQQPGLNTSEFVEPRVDQVEELRRPRDHGLSLPAAGRGSPASAR